MKMILFIVCCLLLFFPVSSRAWTYELIEGNGVEVCEEYGKNLNSLRHFMLCERESNGDFIDFKKPAWVKMDLWENRDLVKKVELFLGLRHAYMDSIKWPKVWEDVLKERIERGSVVIMFSRVDIYNNGKDENVIKYIDGYCPSSKAFGGPLLILNAKRTEVDVAKTIPLMQNVGNVEGWDHAMYDIFTFRKKAYFDRWSGNIDELKYLRVFVNEIGDSESVATKEICRFKFNFPK